MKDVRYQLNTLSRQERCTYEHVVLASTCHWETATTVRKPPRMGRILKNLLDRVSQLCLLFLLPEHLKPDNTVRVNQLSLLALDSIVHFGFSDRRLEQTASFSIPTNSE
ncbi:hypothetical protein Tco_1499699 [Tanacetum coccineum]